MPLLPFRFRSPALRGVAAVTVLLSGCDADPEKSRKAEAEPEAAAPAVPGAPAAAPVRVPTLAEIAARVATEALKAQAGEAAHIARLIKGAGPDARALKLLLAQPDLRFFNRDGNLTVDGTAVLALLGDLDRHGVDKSGYRFDQLDAATRRVTETFAAERAALLTLHKHPRAALVAATAAVWLRGGEGGELALTRAGGDTLAKGALLALDAGLPPLFVASPRAREAVWGAEIEVMRAVLRYLVDMRHGYAAHPLKYQPPAAIRRLTEMHADRLVADLTTARGRTAEVMRKAWPTHGQYAALLAAYATYKKLADGLGWQPLPKLVAKKVAVGDAGPFVVALRQRLQAEGYLVTDGDAYDEELAQVVKTFQLRHQLDGDGIVSKTTATELDVPAAQRLKQIQLSLQRYRESEGRDPEDFYLYVNIAFQKLWVMDGGEVVRTHKVIVGNNDIDADQMTLLKGKINRTKMFSKPMTRIILAPRWFPTQRVVDLEINPALAKDPMYLEKHGYVREMQPDGTELIYQKGGKDNLLGDVKFQGPNQYNIYLHDTPFRQFFLKPRRAYSHGCIRMQDPIDLAELLLARDRGMTPKQIRDAIKEKEEKIVQLKTKVPVHIDYASAGVDEDGNVVFGADVYGYDQAFFDGQLPVEEAKEYKAGSVKGL